MSRSQDNIYNANNDKDTRKDLIPIFSTPLNNQECTPNTPNNTYQAYQIPHVQQLPVMNYSLSSIGPVPPVQHVQQYQGSMQPINYDSKIDNLAKTLDKVFQKLNKLDQIESRISNFETSIKSVTAEVHDLKAKMVEIEKNVVFTSEKFGEREKTSKELVTEMKKSKKINENLEKENKEIKEQLTSITNNLKTLKDQHLDLQSRSMRDNLIFTGIDEQREESADMCEQMLNKFIEEKLGITDEISFHRVHRMGRKQTNKNRPIVAKFVNFKDREKVHIKTKNFYNSVTGSK